jgi:hypothetical protein
MKSCISWLGPRLLVVAVVGAIGLAAPASAAVAQAAQDSKGTQDSKPKCTAAASTPDSVSGVIVEAPEPLDKRIPPDKRAKFDAEAADKEAWTKYRATAAPAPAPKSPGASPQTENYPGLHEVVPH